MQSLNQDLDQLLNEPRGSQADLVVSRVRTEMDAEARRLLDDRPVAATDPELEAVQGQTGGPIWEEGALAVEWWLVHPAACGFLHLLAAWEESGSAAHAEALTEAAEALVASWVAAIRNQLLIERLDDLKVARLDEETLAGATAAMRELALQGLIINTGKQRRGETLWAASDVYQQHGTWDA